MALPLPDLATKTYKDIINEMVESIPKYSNKWTNYNASDPGIIILEFLSWIAECDLYRINNITRSSYINFLRLVAGASGSEVEELLERLEKLERLENHPYSDKAHKEILEFLNDIEGDEFLFSWDSIPGYDTERFIKFLNRHFGIDWVKTAKPKKIDGGDAIELSAGKHFLQLRLNEEKTKVYLKIDDGRTDEFITKTDNSYLFSWDKIPGNDSGRLIGFLKKRFGIDWARDENIRKSEDGTISVSYENNSLSLSLKYLFSWDKIPGNDNRRLTEFLEQEYGIDWARDENIEKIENDSIIRISTGKKSLSIRFNNEKTKANLKIDDDRTDEFIAIMENGKLNIAKIDVNLKINDGRTDNFIAKMENGKLNIYQNNKLNIYNAEKSIVQIKKSALEFLNSKYRAVTEDDFRSLAIEATQAEKNAKVRRAIVNTYPDGRKIEIIIISDGHDKYEDLIKIVKNYLEPRKLIGTRIIVKEPVYTPVKIYIEIVSEFQSEIRKEELRDNIKKRIQDHLDPLTGGYDKKGWSYGRTLTIFEIDRIIEETEGVDCVKLVSFDDDLKLTSKKIDGLIHPVHISIKVIEEEEGK